MSYKSIIIQLTLIGGALAMINLIVLGYVPGTSIQISFASFMLFGLTLLAGWFAIWYCFYYDIKRKATKIAAIQLISL